MKQTVISSSSPTIRKGLLIISFICTLFGAAIALYATNITLLLAKNVTGTSGCTVNEWISCDAVLSTKFATMFGIPVAWLGFLFYFWAALTLLVAMIRKDTQRSAASVSAVLIGTIIAVLFSIYKAVQLIILEKLCPLCLGMYVINFSILLLLIKTAGLSYRRIGIFVFEYLKSSSGLNSKLTFSPRPVLYSIAIVWIFSLGYVGIINYGKNMPLALDKEKSFHLDKALKEFFDITPIKVPVNSYAPVKGGKDATITIVEFADFECQACKMLADNMTAILQEYEGKVKLVFMNYPLDISINPYMNHDLHKYSGIAAIAGVCAQEEGNFWDYYAELFGNQKKINREFLLEVAEKQGLNRKKFEERMNSPEVIQSVKNDIEAGKSIDVQGTPSLFINGRRVEYWNKPEFIKAVINEELKREQFL